MMVFSVDSWMISLKVSSIVFTGVQIITSSVSLTASLIFGSVSSHHFSCLHNSRADCFRAQTLTFSAIILSFTAIHREAPRSPGPKMVTRWKSGMKEVGVLILNTRKDLFSRSLMENNFKEQDPNEDDWGNPPSPNTPENTDKAFKYQIILGIVGLIFISLPAIVIWIVRS